MSLLSHLSFTTGPLGWFHSHYLRASCPAISYSSILLLLGIFLLWSGDAFYNYYRTSSALYKMDYLLVNPLPAMGQISAPWPPIKGSPAKLSGWNRALSGLSSFGRVSPGSLFLPGKWGSPSYPPLLSRECPLKKKKKWGGELHISFHDRTPGLHSTYCSCAKCKIKRKVHRSSHLSGNSITGVFRFLKVLDCKYDPCERIHPCSWMVSWSVDYHL